MTDTSPIELNADQQRQLVDSIKTQLAARYQSEVEQIETHISIVLLVADRAFKIKKPMDFGFLNFTTLAKRKFYCAEELRLNQRLAPDLYLGLIPVCGSLEHPRLMLDDPSEPCQPLDYLIEMRRFEQDALLDRMLGAHKLTMAHMAELAEKMAAFHAIAAIADNSQELGNADVIYAPVEQNFDQIQALAEHIPDCDLHRLDTLRRWSENSFTRLRSRIQQRKADGFVRECHGDMHLGNIAFIQNEIVIFDGIEFNQEFRWIDVMSELAFLLMDLDFRRLDDFGSQVLNRYLEITGDYAGLALMTFYKTYRAMVRAKIAAFRLAQPNLSAADKQLIGDEFHAYVALAERYTLQNCEFIAITYGVSGSGKSQASDIIARQFAAIRIRSDIERQRLFPEPKLGGELNQGRYSPAASEQTYDHILELAGLVAQSGFNVVLDATYLGQHPRRMVRNVADSLNKPFVILAMDTDQETLKTRIRQRIEAGHDASEATLEVLQMQLETIEPLTVAEEQLAIHIAPDSDIAGLFGARLSHDG